jgi:hypothetical protein
MYTQLGCVVVPAAEAVIIAIAPDRQLIIGCMSNANAAFLFAI